MFNCLIDSNNLVNINIRNPNYLATLFGDYLGFIEFEIEPEHWIIAGLTRIYYKRSPQCYSKLIMSGLVFTELFRSYGLGELGSLIGITIIENIGLNDLVFEDATVHQLVYPSFSRKDRFSPLWINSRSKL